MAYGIVNYSFRHFGQRRRTVANNYERALISGDYNMPHTARRHYWLTRLGVLCPSLVDGATRAPCYGCVDSWTSLNRSTVATLSRGHCLES